MTPDEYRDHVADLAISLACRVRDDAPDAVRRWLDATVPAEQRTDLLIALAAAMPTDRTWPELIAWTDGPPTRELRPHGTAAAMARHRYHNERPCADCLAWDARRAQGRRDSKKAAQAA